MAVAVRNLQCRPGLCVARMMLFFGSVCNISRDATRAGILLESDQIDEEHTTLEKLQSEIEINPNPPLNTTL